MSSYTKIAPQLYLNRNNNTDMTKKNNASKLKIMQARKDLNLFNSNEFMTINSSPFSKYNSVI